MNKIPEGTILKEGQSWNEQHGYVQTQGKLCNKDVLITAYTASGATEALPWLKRQAAKGVDVPPYATFRLWVLAKTAKSPASPSKATTPAAPDAPEVIKAQIAKLQEAYKESLLSKVDRLRVEIDRLQQELAAAERELEEITA
ncbi:hypothetical protein [Pseudomonas faucium]|uniref:hypothetical protein n=1 Tax=Pseudomonas faucium TaxID=2740518 RepID=UPI0015968E65|nr:hypothetical protein [Pseudomonas faucium]